MGTPRRAGAQPPRTHPVRCSGCSHAALAALSRARQLTQDDNATLGEEVPTYRIGMAYLKLGQLDRAATCFTETGQLAVRAGDRLGQV